MRSLSRRYTVTFRGSDAVLWLAGAAVLIAWLSTGAL